MTSNPLFLGLDIGGTKCAALVGNMQGQIVSRAEWPSDARRGPGPMIEDLCEHARRLIAAADTAPPLRAGVVIGGPLDTERGIVHSPPNLPGWTDIPLRDLLAERLRIPIDIAHDAAACALAEQTWGAAAGCSRVAFLTCATGFGVGLVFDGKMYTGAAGRSPEIGHIRYREDGPVAYGKGGSFEAYCAASNLPALAAWRYPARWSNRPPAPPQLSQLAREGDADAQEILNINARATGDSCALLADLLALDVIVLGSLALYLGDPWLEKVRAQFKAECLPENAGRCRIQPSALGARLQDCSALVIAVASHRLHVG